MTPPEFYKWWISDAHTGERCLSAYRLTRADAERAFPGAEPDLQTRERRYLPKAGDAPASSRPGEEWA